MQAIEREIMSNDWVAMIFLLGVLLMFLLKLFSAKKTKGYALSIFNKGFIEIESEDKNTGVSFFNIIFTAFSFLSISLTIFFFINIYTEAQETDFLNYTKIASYVFIYMGGRFFLEWLLMILFELKESLNYFFLSKRSYLYAISIGLFFLNAIYFYGFPEDIVLFSGVVSLFGIRIILILTNNKNLIIKELFYFILYLCAFEIAPLLILFKLIF